MFGKGWEAKGEGARGCKGSSVTLSDGRFFLEFKVKTWFGNMPIWVSVKPVEHMWRTSIQEPKLSQPQNPSKPLLVYQPSKRIYLLLHRADLSAVLRTLLSQVNCTETKEKQFLASKISRSHGHRASRSKQDISRANIIVSAFNGQKSLFSHASVS